MVKNLSEIVGDVSSIPGLGRSTGERNGYPFQYCCLGIRWKNEPRGLQSRGRKDSDTIE